MLIMVKSISIFTDSKNIFFTGQYFYSGLTDIKKYIFKLYLAYYLCTMHFS